MKIKMTVTLTDTGYQMLLAVLYAERKRLTDLHENALAHGDIFDPPQLEAIDQVLNGLQYGELIEGAPPVDDPLADLRRKATPPYVG